MVVSSMRWDLMVLSMAKSFSEYMSSGHLCLHAHPANKE